MASFAAKDEIIVSTSYVGPKRCLGNEVVVFSLLAAGGPGRACYNLLRGSAMIIVCFLSYVMNLSSDFSKHVKVPVSAVIMSCIFRFVILHILKTNFVVVERTFNVILPFLFLFVGFDKGVIQGRDDAMASSQGIGELCGVI